MSTARRRWQAAAGCRYIPPRMSHLLLYHDFASPFCRLAVPVAGVAAERTGLAVRPVPFELRPAPAPLPAPDERTDPEREELDTARRVADEWGLPLGEMPRIPRTRKAHEAVAYARAHDAGDAVLVRIYDALWRDGLDIARLDVLADIGEAAGLDRQAMHIALGLDDLRDDVLREQAAATAAGLTGVPTFQVGDATAVGLFAADELVAWIQENR